MPIPKFEDYKAPWELDRTTGEEIAEEEQKLDSKALKKYLHNLMSDKERLQGSVAAVTAERDEAKTEIARLAQKDEGTDAASARKVQEAIEKARSEGAEEGKAEGMRLDIALDVPGITPKQARRMAKRLTGKTAEEMRADAADLAADFGITDEPDEVPDDDGGYAGRPVVRTASADPKRESADFAPDLSDDALAKMFPRN